MGYVMHNGFEASKYQEAIFDFVKNGRGNGLIVAAAGAAKSTTLVECAKLVTGGSAFFAFNVHVAADIQAKVGSSVTAQTINSLGMQTLKRELGNNLKLDRFKYQDLVDKWSEKAVLKIGCPYDSREAKDTREAVRQFTDACRLHLVSPKDSEAMIAMSDYFSLDYEYDDRETIFWAVDNVIADGIAQADSRYPVIDFIDQLFLPYVWNLTPKQSLFCAIDECLPYKIPVLLADGTSVEIGKLVEEKMPVEVLSYNTETGQQEICKVTGWSKTPNRKPLVEIKAMPLNGKRETYSVTCTIDHKIWMAKSHSWLFAEDITPGMIVQFQPANSAPVHATVVSVKPTTIDDDFVYDITVEKCHNFYANGILVHNCQDLNRAQLDMVLKTCAPGGRTLFCGDPSQSIMLFAFADEKSFYEIKERTNATVFPLSISYRCPKSHIRLAQELVPTIEASPNAIEGTVKDITVDELNKMVRDGDTIIARCTSPLIKQCLTLIAMGVPARVRGRDIGSGLVAFLKQVAKAKNFDFANFQEHLDLYVDLKTRKLMKKKNCEDQIQSLRDKANCLEIIHTGKFPVSLNAFMANIQELFDDNRVSVQLATVHKMKGSESDRIFILQPQKLPLVWVGQTAAHQQQELNVKYVALTRAKKEMYFVHDNPVGEVKIDDVK